MNSSTASAASASTSEKTTSLLKILYNNRYGGFSFSGAFIEEFEKRTGKSADYTQLLTPSPVSVRCHPVAIALFEEKGSEWCSGPYAEIQVTTIPEVFAKYWDIDEYDGNETVRVDVNAALADVLETFMDTDDREALNSQYATIKAAITALSEIRTEEFSRTFNSIDHLTSS